MRAICSMPCGSPETKYEFHALLAMEYLHLDAFFMAKEYFIKCLEEEVTSTLLHCKLNVHKIFVDLQTSNSPHQKQLKYTSNTQFLYEDKIHFSDVGAKRMSWSCVEPVFMAPYHQPLWALAPIMLMLLSYRWSFRHFLKKLYMDSDEMRPKNEVQAEK